MMDLGLFVEFLCKIARMWRVSVALPEFLAGEDEPFLDVEAVEDGLVGGRDELEVAVVGVGFQGHLGDALVGRFAAPGEGGFPFDDNPELEVAGRGELESAFLSAGWGFGVVVRGPQQKASVAGAIRWVAAPCVLLPHAQGAFVEVVAFEVEPEPPRL